MKNPIATLLFTAAFLTLPACLTAEIGMTSAEFDAKFGKANSHGLHIAAGYAMKVRIGPDGKVVRIEAASKNGIALTEVQAKALVKSLIGDLANSWTIDAEDGNRVMVEDPDFAELEDRVEQLLANSWPTRATVVQAILSAEDPGSLVQSGNLVYYVENPPAWSDRETHNVRLARTGENYSYTSVDGAISTVPIVQILPEMAAPPAAAEPKTRLNGASLNGADGL